MAKTDWGMNDTVMPEDMNQIGEELNAKETPAGAQAKADEALAAANQYADEQIAQIPPPTAPVTSVNGKAGTIVLTASDVGADAAGSAAAVQSNLNTHAADAIKHITAGERIAWNGKASTEFVQYEIDNKAFITRPALAADADWNNIVALGSYQVGVTTGQANHPNMGDWMVLDVTNSSGYVTQTVTSVTGSGTKKRMFNGGSWLPWKQIDIKRDCFIAYPHIAEGQVYLDSTDFFAEAGFLVTFIASINTTIHQIIMNGTPYQISNEGADSVDVINNGTYTFVWSHNYFFLRSGGGGSGGKLNVYTGTAQPIKKEGVWINSAITKGKVVTDANVYSAGEMYNGPEIYNTPTTTSLTTSGTITISGSIYYFQAPPSQSGQSCFYRYNKSTNTWTQLALVSAWVGSSNRPYLSFHNGFIYVTFLTKAGSLRTVWKYNVSSNTWVDTGIVPPDSIITAHNSATVKVNTRQYFIGGGGSSSSTKGIQIFDYTTELFTASSATLSLATWGMACGYYNGKIIALGGHNSGGYNFDKYEYTIASDTCTRTQNFTNTTNSPVLAYGFVQIGNILYSGEEGTPKTTLAWNLETLTCTIHAYSPTDNYGVGLYSDNGDSLMMYALPSNAVVGRGRRLMFVDKAYPANTIIIVRNSNTIGTYYSELVSAKGVTGLNARLTTGFDDVHYHNGAQLIRGLPTYYGNGSSWIQYK